MNTEGWWGWGGLNTLARRGQRSLLGGWVLYAQHHNSHRHWPEVDHPVCGFPKSVSSPTALFGHCLFICLCCVAWGIGRRQLNSYSSSLVGSRGQCSANEAQVKGGSPRWAIPVSWGGSGWPQTRASAWQTGLHMRFCWLIIRGGSVINLCVPSEK